MRITLLVLMGYGPTKGYGGLGLEIQGWKMAQRNLKNNTGFLKLIYRECQLKLNFGALRYFEGLQIKQTTQVNDNNNKSLF